MEQKLQELKTRLQEISDLNAAISILSWDQTTYMPPGGGPARGRQMSTLARLAHEKFIDPEVGALLDALLPYEESLPPDSTDASLIRVTRRDYERDTKVPPMLMARFYQHIAEGYDLWTRARPANDFGMVRDSLAKTLDFSHQIAECFPGYTHIADPLIDFFDYGMKAASIRAVFADLRGQLAPLVQQIAARPVPSDACLHAQFPEAGQLAFGIEVIKCFGFDFDRGRQDKTHHPFMTKFSSGDVRITTRVKEGNLGEALFSTMHEAGHALYELGIDPAFEGTPLHGGTSAGVHESQSRTWENLVGRSRPFWQFFYPRLQQAFPSQLGDVALETFYRAINMVRPSLIRTEADEVTYNLHVMIRFEFELQLLEGTLSIDDLPQAWHEAYHHNLGVHAPDDQDGVLQDVHWYGGVIGGSFQGYTLGNIIAAQFYSKALAAHPEIPAEMGNGEFGTLHGWLKDNIYRHGRKFTALELLERVTGGGLTIEPYVAYLKGKYGEIYGL